MRMEMVVKTDDDDLKDPILCITLPPGPISLNSSYSQTYLTFQSFTSETYSDVGR